MERTSSPLKTGRLELQEFTPADLDAVHALHSLPETDRYNTMGIPGSLAETQAITAAWLEEMQAVPTRKYVFCIRNSSGDFVGITGINPGKAAYRTAEIWYKLHPSHWNNGYATEAVKALLQFCFTELQLHRVQAGCATANTASVNVLEKSGFLREGHCRKKLPIRGEWLDNYEYAILEEAYFSLPG